MSGKVQNRIITDGLIFYADASNPRSYVSGSTKVYDLTKYKTSIDFYNSPTFDTGSGGSFVFNGGNAIRANTTNTLLNVGAGGAVTIEAFVKPSTTASNLQSIVTYGVFDSAPAVVNYSLAYFNSKIGFSANNGGSYIGSTTMAINQWHGLTVVFNNTTNIGYQDGVQVGTFSTATAATTSTILSIGASFYSINAISTYKFTGNIAHTRIYNRALSAAEVLQNYNALKGRFGL